MFHGTITYTGDTLEAASRAIAEALDGIQHGFGGMCNVLDDATYRAQHTELISVDGPVPLDWASAEIADARTFTMGYAPQVVHRATHVAPNLVRSQCGIFAPVKETPELCAQWADALATCPTCCAAE